MASGNTARQRKAAMRLRCLQNKISLRLTAIPVLATHLRACATVSLDGDEKYSLNQALSLSMDGIAC